MAVERRHCHVPRADMGSGTTQESYRTSVKAMFDRRGSVYDVDDRCADGVSPSRQAQHSRQADSALPHMHTDVLTLTPPPRWHVLVRLHSEGVRNFAARPQPPPLSRA